jgi:hypothetical protein
MELVREWLKTVKPDADQVEKVHEQYTREQGGLPPCAFPDRLLARHLIYQVIGSPAYIMTTISDPHKTIFTPTGAPGIFQDPCPIGIIPAAQGDKMVHIALSRSIKYTSAVALEIGIHINHTSDRAISHDGIFDGVGGCNCVPVFAKVPGLYKNSP